MKLYFELKKLNDKQGSIRVIIGEKKGKEIISTGLKINITDWSKEIGRPKEIGKNANLNLTLNKYVSAYEKYITQKQLANELTSLTSAREYIDANVNTVNKERGKKDFSDLLEQFKKDNEGKLTEGAIKPYVTLINHLHDYNSKLQFNDFNQKFADKFCLYLSKKSKHIKGAKDLQNPTLNKMLVTLKAFCKWALSKRHTSATEWLEIKPIKEIEQRIITLTSAELNQYATYKFKQKSYSQQRDVFCFACYTGLRFEDLKQVNFNNIKQVDNQYYIHINTDKTLAEIKIKLVSQAVAILKRYNFVLPLISNQKTNIYIKEGLEIASINRIETVVVQHLNKHHTVNKPLYKLVSIHDARKSFVTLALEGGMSIAEVMAVSTHKDYRSFSRYVQLEAQRVNNKLQSVFPTHLKKVS
jgi:site-specific recombinase XerD